MGLPALAPRCADTCVLVLYIVTKLNEAPLPRQGKKWIHIDDGFPSYLCRQMEFFDEIFFTPQVLIEIRRLRMFLMISGHLRYPIPPFEHEKTPKFRSQFLGVAGGALHPILLQCRVPQSFLKTIRSYNYDFPML